MGISLPKIILSITFTFLLITIVFICVGATGKYWLEFQPEKTNIGPSRNNFGLYERCDDILDESTCIKRSDVLNFKSGTTSIHLALDDKDLDTVLLLLIMSVCFAFFSAIVAVTMFFANGVNSWKCGAISTGILAVIGAVLALAGLGYFESLLEDEDTSLSETYDHKWSSIITWAGAMTQIIAAVLSFVMICVKPKPDYSNQGHIVYAHNNVTSYPRKEYKMDEKPTYENRGYDDERREQQRESGRYQDEYRETRNTDRGYREEDRDGRGHRGESRDYRDRSRDYQDNSRSYEIERRGHEQNRRNDNNYDRHDNNTHQPSYDNRRQPSHDNHRRRDSYEDNTRPYTISSGNKVRNPSYDNDGYVLR